VRSTYREALEDGMSDDVAAEKVLGDFAPDLGDADARSVVWLALAAAQSTVGRLRDDVRAQALRAVDSGENMRLWEHLDAKLVAKRSRGLAVIGKGDIDLSQARFIDGEMTIHATVITGNIIIVVPEGAEVHIGATGIIGLRPGSSWIPSLRRWHCSTASWTPNCPGTRRLWKCHTGAASGQHRAPHVCRWNLSSLPPDVLP
jgi:hypothetical protein